MSLTLTFSPWAGTAGTAQYNLRGLGLGSTLTLLNGRRAVGAGSNASFVDINTLMPQIAVEKVEILKDGASSLYGSDAVAGVVNHITRDDLVGAEVVFDYRNGQGSQETFQGDAIFGGEFGPNDTNVVLSLSYVNQSRLLASDQDFATVSSGVGSPGSFFLLDGDNMFYRLLHSLSLILTALRAAGFQLLILRI